MFREWDRLPRGVKLLRDVREATRLLILLDVTTRRPRTLKPLAERLDMTVQGVSEYLKGMASEGLLLKGVDGYRATKKGVKFLHDHMRALREFVEVSAKEMRFVDVTMALAGENISEGEEVGLFMEGGYLVARPRRPSPSRGRALTEATKGEGIAITDLQGIVELSPGMVTIMALPAKSKGGRLAHDKGKDIVVAGDVVGKAWALALGWDVDLEYAPIQGTIDAALRGQGVVVLVSQDGAQEFVAAMEATNQGLEDRIRYRVLKVR